MKQKKNVSTTKKQKYSVVARRRITILLTVIIIALLFSVITISQAIMSTLETAATLEQRELDLMHARERKEVLENELERLDDPEYIVQYARDEYYVMSEDEILFILPKEEQSEETSTIANR